MKTTQRRKILGSAVIVCLLCGLTAAGYGAWTISNPTDGEDIVYNSNILTDGEMDMGADVWIKILTPSGATAGEYHFEAGENDADWEKDFPAPQDGWTPVANGWQVKIYDSSSAGTAKAFRNFDITNGGA